MFNNVVLDVFIGLIFIYLLYSLLATVIQEILSQWFSLRSRMLVKAIRRMLEDDIIDSNNYWKNNSMIGFLDSLANLFARFFLPIRKDENLVKKFYGHPTIKYLGENRLFSKPAYLHSHNFSQTILQLLRGDQYDGRFQSESSAVEESLRSNNLEIKPETLRHLKLLFADARQDSNLFKLKLEDWFDETMQRCTGWYKKQTQTIMIIVGFCLAWSFNVDTIAISKILMKDKTAREQLVQLAISRQKEYGTILDTLSKTTTVKKEKTLPGDSGTTTIETTVNNSPSQSFLDTAYNQLRSDAFTVQGILGLKGLPSSADSSDCKMLASTYDALIAKETDSERKTHLIKMKAKAAECCYETLSKNSIYQQDDFLKIIGCLITALAISLGSSFWFDLLNRLVKLRGAGTKPNSTADTDTLKNNASSVSKDKNNMDIKG